MAPSPPPLPRGVAELTPQGKPSPLPAPRLWQTGGRQASKASSPGSAPASGSESPPARREGLLPRRESLWLGEGRRFSTFYETIKLGSPLPHFIKLFKRGKPLGFRYLDFLGKMVSCHRSQEFTIQPPCTTSFCAETEGKKSFSGRKTVSDSTYCCKRVSNVTGARFMLFV